MASAGRPSARATAWRAPRISCRLASESSVRCRMSAHVGERQGLRGRAGGVGAFIGRSPRGIFAINDSNVYVNSTAEFRNRQVFTSYLAIERVCLRPWGDGTPFLYPERLAEPGAAQVSGMRAETVPSATWRARLFRAHWF